MLLVSGEECFCVLASEGTEKESACCCEELVGRLHSLHSRGPRALTFQHQP
jgi:hypothetical protein